ncbi:MAG: class I tRNA ligase family protein, partial [Candidatus Paceibacterota bacterium]
DYFSKTYFHWIDKLGDWCISRQIWYGHRIPVWYKGENIFCGDEAPKEDGWSQDEDTLDTWFSSAMWTFSTLGWPEKTKDLSFYHPTDVLETGYEILFFWVARMILMTGYNLGTIPFHTIYLHGTVRDAKGRKMSKTLGNGIDPIDIANKFGADAGRMSLIIGNTPGTDMNISEDKVKAYKNFANKIWNITRFVLESTKDTKYVEDFNKYSEADKKLIEERDSLLSDVTKDMEDYRFYMAGDKIYQYTWKNFADVILEDSKKIFVSDSAPSASSPHESASMKKESRKQFLLNTLRIIITSLHPFMPFVTEEIWQSIKNEKDNVLMIENWPIKG